VAAAAKKEGKVTIFGPQGTDISDAYTQGFEKKYPGIQVDFSGMAGPQVSPKLLGALTAGQHPADIVIAGSTTVLLSLRPANALQPLQPFLIGPDIEPAKWTGGKLDFADNDGQYDLAYAARVQIPFIYSTKTVKQSDFKSWKDLLDPKWKDKILMQDPRIAGAGLDIVSFLYAHEGLGPDYLKALFAQNILIQNDARQMIDLVASGERPIGIGPNGTIAWDMKNQGVPIELFPGEALQEGSFITASNSNLAIIRDLEHPNATKLYLDYLLSAEGQAAASKATGLASLRLDVPRSDIPDAVVPKPGVKYLENYKEPYQKQGAEILSFIKTVVPG